MGKRLMALAVALALVVGLCPGTALAAPGLTAGSATGRDAAPAAQVTQGAALTAQASKAKATKLAKKATKLMNALPKQSKVKLTHVKKVAVAFGAVSAATRDWAAFGKVGSGTRKAFLKAFNKKFAPACYALEKKIKDATAKAKKAQVKDVKVTPGSGSATVSWKKLGSSYGYEVYYSTSESSGYQRAGSTKAENLAVKGLDGGKKYYFKVRPFRADIPATSLIGTMSKVVYGKYSAAAAATPAAPLATTAAKRGLGSAAATTAAEQATGSPASGAALGTQAASALSDPNVQDAFDSCRVYLRDIKGKKGYATGTLKGDLEKMRGVVDSLNTYADKAKADRAKESYDALNNVNAPSDWTTEAVWQDGAGLNQITVMWGVPANAKRDDVSMQHWRVSWRKLGDEKWSGPATVAYSSSPYAARQYTVTGLAQGTTYEVRVGYRYQVGGDGGSYVTVDDWRSCTATTGMTLTFGESSFDYHFTAHNESRAAALEASVAGPKAFDNYTTKFWYEWYVTPGSSFDAAAAEKGRSGHYMRFGYYEMRENKFTSYADSSPSYGLTGGYAVATVGVRTIFRSTSRDSKYNLIETMAKSRWSTKKVVADPQFLIGKDITNAKYEVTGFVVKIPPLKGAKSYTVYLGKRKSASSSKVTGWKVAGTFAARDGKTTEAVVKSYGGKKLPKNFNSKEWAVKVVTNTPYGSSPGDYWRSYNHQDLIPHEGMIY